MVAGHSDDWVFDTDVKGRITRVGKVGDDQYNMVGLSWFMKEDAHRLGTMIDEAYGKDGFENLFWDDVVNQNLDKLDLIVHEVEKGQLVEIDTVQELMEIDPFYRQYSMDEVIKLIENTVNQSAVKDFRNFIAKFSDITKWILCSDYCIDDKNKPNNVMSFVLYPYTFDINQWQKIIGKLQPNDIKNSSHITEEFREFTHLGLFFSFNIVFDKNGTIFDAWKNKDVLISLVDQYIEMMNIWKVNTPRKKEQYDNSQSQLKRIRSDMNAKSFNVKLFHRTVVTVLVASYIKYLLICESDRIEIYSWLSDRDKITSMGKGVYSDLYAIISHCICAQKLDEDKYKGITEIHPGNLEKEFFWDLLNRVPDVICGVLADHNLTTNEVSKEKHLEGVEDILSDNPNIVVLYMDSSKIGRVHYTKELSDSQTRHNQIGEKDKVSC